MDTARFIASRIISRSSAESEQKSGLKPIIYLAVMGIALGVCIMTISVSVVRGFQHEIQSKVIGFGGHLQIRNYQSFQGLDDSPVSVNQQFYPGLDSVEGVRNIQVFLNKAGILKTEEELQGVIIKGIGRDFDWHFFKQNLITGDTFEIQEEERSEYALISQRIANRLRLSLDDKFYVYFIQDGRPRPRKFIVNGIYNTGLAEFDDKIVLADLRHIQRINGWDSTQVGGFEVNVNDFSGLSKLDYLIEQHIGYSLKTDTIIDRHPEIFSWLSLMDNNVTIILILMILVSGITMSTALLILILERTQMIGLLKALGGSNWIVRKVFLIHAAYLISLGLIIGNLLGIGLCFIQSKFHFISLPEATYYLSYVPIKFDWLFILSLNVGTLLTCMIILLLPSAVITKISPVKVIRFS